ncbi:MAG: hypothetical protein AB1779_02805 [Candidatus Thermoplasmatota archaeon]
MLTKYTDIYTISYNVYIGEEMGVKSILTILVLILPLVAIEEGIVGISANNDVEQNQKFLEYGITFTDTFGIMTISEAGIEYNFSAFGWSPIWEESHYGPEWYGEYALYYIEGWAHYEIILKNIWVRNFVDISITTIQEYPETYKGVDYTGEYSIQKGEKLPGDAENTWYISKLAPNEEVKIKDEYYIPYGVHPTLVQVHLIIKAYKENNGVDPDNRGKGKEVEGAFIIDTIAGIYCPKIA